MQRRSPEAETVTAPSRRSVLRASGAAVAAATSLSGCLSAVPLLDGGSGRTDVALPPAGPASFRDWIPVDGVRGIESIGSPWVFTPQRDGSDHLGRPMGFARSFLAPLIDYFGVGIGEYEWGLMTGDSVVLHGPADPDAVGDTLLDSGYDTGEPYREFDVYERFDGPRTCAVRSGTVVWARGAAHRQRVLAHVDAAAGDVERLPEAVPAYGRLAEHVGTRPFLTTRSDGGSQFVEDATAGANGFDVDERGLYRLSVAVLASGADPSRGEVRDRFAASVAADDVQAIGVTIDDGVVTMAARVSLDAARAELDRERAFPPQVTWGVDPEPGRYVLRHEAGDPVDASRLDLRGADHDEHPFAAGGEGTIEQGDELAIDRGAVGPEFRLIWTGPTDESALLFEYRDPESGDG